MQDLTQGSIPKHVGLLAAPIAIGMVFQTLYFLIDLYFVSRLGEAATAGVSAAGSINFVIMALTQILGAGAGALIAQATGRKDRDDAKLIFNQSLVLATLCTVATLVVGFAAAGSYMSTLGADAATRDAGTVYLRWVLPGLALQFALVVMSSALRGTGIVKPTMIVQMLTVVLNAALSPIMIAGWLTGKPLGVLGAALATTISIAVGVVFLALYFVRLEDYVVVDRSMIRPRLEAWGRILKIGVPPGGEFALMFVYLALIYWIIRDFGAAAQAGFGIGSRVMQAIFVPALAVSLAAGPLAGQNFGAGATDRVRATFRSASVIGTAIMLVLMILCQWRPEILVGIFTDEAAVVAVGVEFLRIISWNFMATGMIFTASSMFQGLGNTWPALLASATRLVTFALPALWLQAQPGFTLRQLWYLSLTTVVLQMGFSLWLLKREFARKLAPPSAQPVVARL